MEGARKLTTQKLSRVHIRSIHQVTTFLNLFIMGGDVVEKFKCNFVGIQVCLYYRVHPMFSSIKRKIDPASFYNICVWFNNNFIFSVWGVVKVRSGFSA